MSRRLSAALLGFVGVLLGLGLMVSPASRAVAPTVTTATSPAATGAAAGTTHHGVVEHQAERLLAPARKQSKTGPLSVTPATPGVAAPRGVRVARAPPVHTNPRFAPLQRPTGRSPPAPAGT